MKFPIPQDWDGVSWCRWSICWPDSERWRGLLRGLVTLPQRGWTWDERSGDLMAVIEVGKEITALNLPLEGVLMSCNDGTNDALNNIAAALTLLANNQPASSGCCDDVSVIVNNSVQTTVNQPVGGNPVPVYGSQPPLVVPPGTFPDEFSDEASYLVSKCQIANALADGLIYSVRNMSNITAFSTGALGGLILTALAGVIIFPPAAIPVMIGALIVLSVGIQVLNSVADEMQTRRNDIVCILYTSDSTEGIIGLLADLFDIIIAAVGTTTTIGFAVKTVLLLLTNSDTLNQLFSGNAALAYPGATCNCDQCENPVEKTWTFLADEEGWAYDCLSASCPPVGFYHAPFDALAIVVDSNIAAAAVQTWRSPDGCYTGDAFQVNLSAQSGGHGIEVVGRVHYVDGTEFEGVFVANLGTNPTNYDIQLDLSKNVLWVEVQWTYNLAPGFSFVCFLSNPAIFIQA